MMSLIYHNYKPSYYPYFNRGWREENRVHNSGIETAIAKG